MGDGGKYLFITYVKPSKPAKISQLIMKELQDDLSC